MGGAEGFSAGSLLPGATGTVSPHMINFDNTAEVGGAGYSRLVSFMLLRISLNGCCVHSMVSCDQYNFKATVNNVS